jgi:hypothetical protein
MTAIPSTAILLFAKAPPHPFVPLASRIAVARSGGPGRPTGRRDSALPWTAASTMAGWASIGRKVFSVATLLAIMLSASGGALALDEAPAAPVPVAQAAPVVPVERTPLGEPFAEYIVEAAHRFGLPAAWIRVVLSAESNGDPHARSPRGAMGLMQIMPETWGDLRDRYALGDDPFDPRANILAGAAYLREMFERFGSPGFLAAYHAGPERYRDHVATGRPLPAETRTYVALLAPMVNGTGAGSVVPLSVKPEPWTDAPIFVARAERTPAADPVQIGRLPNDVPAATSGRDLSAILPQSAGLFVSRSSPKVPQ